MIYDDALKSATDKAKRLPISFLDNRLNRMLYFEF